MNRRALGVHEACPSCTPGRKRRAAPASGVTGRVCVRWSLPPPPPPPPPPPGWLSPPLPPSAPHAPLAGARGPRARARRGRAAGAPRVPRRGPPPARWRGACRGRTGRRRPAAHRPRRCWRRPSPPIDGGGERGAGRMGPLHCAMYRIVLYCTVRGAAHHWCGGFVCGHFACA